MNFFGVLVSFLSLAIKFSTVFLFGATGEIINQKSGHLNMGTPGIMYFGALGGVLGERIYIMCTPATAPLNPFLICRYLWCIWWFGFLFLHRHIALQSKRYWFNINHIRCWCFLFIHQWYANG